MRKITLPKVDYPDSKYEIKKIVNFYDEYISEVSKKYKRSEVKIFSNTTLVFSMLLLIFETRINRYMLLIYIGLCIILYIAQAKFMRKIKKGVIDKNKGILIGSAFNMLAIGMFILTLYMVIHVNIFGIYGNMGILIVYISLILIFSIYMFLFSIKGPKKFIKEFQYNNRKKTKSSGSTVVSAVAGVFIAKRLINSGYMIIMIIISLPIVCILLGSFIKMGIYEIFVAMQYDEIEKLRKKIN